MSIPFDLWKWGFFIASMVVFSVGGYLIIRSFMRAKSKAARLEKIEVANDYRDTAAKRAHELMMQLVCGVHF